MGNKNHAETLRRLINPRNENPYLHIDPASFEYVPRWSGMSLEFGRVEGRDGSRITYLADRMVQVPLLPPVSKIPAPEFDTSVRAELVINSLFDELILPNFMSHHNIIACSHGTNWGFAPELSLVGAFERVGVVTRKHKGKNMFPKVGGRNRIQTHAILLDR